jgi:hypothetical protein
LSKNTIFVVLILLSAVLSNIFLNVLSQSKGLAFGSFYYQPTLNIDRNLVFYDHSKEKQKINFVRTSTMFRKTGYSNFSLERTTDRFKNGIWMNNPFRVNNL